MIYSRLGNGQLFFSNSQGLKAIQSTVIRKNLFWKAAYGIESAFIATHKGDNLSASVIIYETSNVEWE